MKSVNLAVLLIAAVFATPAIAQDKGAAKGGAADKANMEILRDKVKADKKVVVAQNMELTDAEAKGFWPVYDAYQKDLQALNAKTMTTIKAYADAYNKGPVADDVAKKLLNDAISLEDEEVKLKRSYIPKLDKVLPGAKVARYMQIENKLRALVKMELAANIPLVY
jgi:hypothetical protein